MINYVNNAYDKCLKPCNAQQFSNIINSPKTEELIALYRRGDSRAKVNLPALTYMGVIDEEKYKKYVKQCCEQGMKEKGSRCAEFMRPTGLLMLDFDHEPNPQALYTRLANQLGEERIALAHITPSGQGLRLVLQRTKGKSIEQEQYEICQAMEVKCDDVCKDISRLSFAPMQREILYFNPSLLFAPLPEESDYPNGSLWGGDPLRATLGNEVRWPQGKATPSAPQSSARHDSVAQSTVLPSLSTACHLGNPLKASFAINRGTVIGATSHPEGERQQTPPLFIEGVPEGRGSSKQSAEQTFDTEYNGVPYPEIVARLEEQLGGRPERGARNSFIFTMACNLRYICDDNADWVASILPTYGEETQKHRMTIQSAINRPMSREMPEVMKRALSVAKMSAEAAEGTRQPSTLNPQHSVYPTLPTALPEPVALLTSRTPLRMKPAVAMSIFPSLGAHLHDVRFAYWDGRDYEPTFMHVLVGELSSGKSAVNTPIEYILADIEARDEVALKREREWKEKCACLPSTQERPERPKGMVVQVLPADMTNAAFVQRLADAEGHFLYTQMDEIELLDALKTNGRTGSVSAVLRLAFDCGKYGQVRVAANAISAMVRVRWNWNASSTVQRVRKFFAGSIADGTLSRLSFSTIIKDREDAYGRNRPKYQRYGESFADELRSYIDRLNTCKGTLHCPEAETWAEQLCDELSDFAEEMEDEAYATMSYRAVLMGFFRAMVLYVMNGMQWTKEIADFAAWSVRYDLWCKMRFFGDMLHKDLEGEHTSVQRGPVSLLTMLPSEFTRGQLQNLRIAQGMKPNPREMLKTWAKRGLIMYAPETDTYLQVGDRGGDN